MRPKTLLVLSLAALALGAFIFFYEQDLPSTDERAELAKKVLRLEDDALRALLIEWGDQTVRLERQRPPADDASEGDAGDESTLDRLPSSALSGGWRIVSPLEARADAGAVDTLVGSLTGLESSRVFEDFDRDELGLADPRGRVTLVADDEQTVLEIGAEIPASSDMVVTIAGAAKAYRVASSLVDDLTRAPGDWRDKKLFAGTRGDVDRLTLLAAGPEASEAKIMLAKRGDDFWIEGPLTDRADEERINTLFSELAGLRAETFLDEPLLTAGGMGLEPPQGVLEVVLAGQERPFRLELGVAASDEGSFYGRADSQLFEVKTRLPESFAMAAADWRSKSWTALQVFKIEGVGFEHAEGSFEIRRDGADWKRGEDRIGYTVVSDLLYPIAEAKARQVLERSAAIASGHDLEQALLKITLSTQNDEDQPTVEELALFAVVDGLAAATSGDRDAVLLLGEDDVGEILAKLAALRTAEPLPDEDEEANAEASEASE